MKKSWNSAIRTYKTVWSVDRFYFLYTIVYNLLKQFFNVFYSVYFLRTLLAYIENGQSVLRIVALLLFMACVEIVFYHLDNHLKQVYFVNFETKLKENVNENIFHAARNAGYEVFCDPKFLNQYRQVLDNTAAKMAGIVQASGAACGLCFALGLVLVYLVCMTEHRIVFDFRFPRALHFPSVLLTEDTADKSRRRESSKFSHRPYALAENIHLRSYPLTHVAPSSLEDQLLRLSF